MGGVNALLEVTNSLGCCERAHVEMDILAS